MYNSGDKGHPCLKPLISLTGSLNHPLLVIVAFALKYRVLTQLLKDGPKFMVFNVFSKKILSTLSNAFSWSKLIKITCFNPRFWAPLRRWIWMFQFIPFFSDLNLFINVVTPAIIILEHNKVSISPRCFYALDRVLRYINIYQSTLNFGTKDRAFCRVCLHKGKNQRAWSSRHYALSLGGQDVVSAPVRTASVRTR